MDRLDRPHTHHIHACLSACLPAYTNDTHHALHSFCHSHSNRTHRRTLFNLFTKARHPERVRVGVVQQNRDGDMGQWIFFK